MVTVETALTVPVMVLMLVAVLVAGRLAVSQVGACQEAAQRSRQQLIERAQDGTFDYGSTRPGSGSVAEVGRPVTVVRPPLRVLGFTLPAAKCTVGGSP